MLPKGTTFFWDGHVWFNLSEPTKTDSYVLCVNLTTLDEDCPDDECVLNQEDYSWIRAGHPTAVAFSRAKVWDANKILQCLQSGAIQQPINGNIPMQTVQNIIEIARTSRELSTDFKGRL